MIIAQNLLPRTNGVGALKVTGTYDAATEQAVGVFQAVYQLPMSGMLDAATASALLDNNSADGYVDNLDFPLPAQYLYKVYIRVHADRNIRASRCWRDVCSALC